MLLNQLEQIGKSDSHGVDADREAGQRDVVVDRGRYPDALDRPIAGFVRVTQQG